jgi:phosphate starvation-inducible PhoH-like protein
VVRHPVVARIVEAYEAFEQQEQIQKTIKEQAYREREQKRQLIDKEESAQ